MRLIVNFDIEIHNKHRHELHFNQVHYPGHIRQFYIAMKLYESALFITKHSYFQLGPLDAF